MKNKERRKKIEEFFVYYSVYLLLPSLKEEMYNKYPQPGEKFSMAENTVLILWLGVDNSG